MRAILSGVLALALLLAAGAAGPPVRYAQVDLFLAAPVDAAAVRRIAARVVPAAVRAALAELGPDRARAFSAGAGAQADDGAERKVLRAVDVESVAADRVRIRVAAPDMLAGHAVAGTVAQTMVGAGLPERVRLTGETRGGGTMALVVWGVLGLALALLGVGVVRWGVGRRNAAVARRLG